MKIKIHLQKKSSRLNLQNVSHKDQKLTDNDPSIFKAIYTIFLNDIN